MTANSAELTIIVKRRTGDPVPETVVTISGPGARGASIKQDRAVMDQVAMRFVPEVLVIPVGSTVDFPNSDSVSHQVYSFSKAKRFQLPLYKGAAHPPVQFDEPGLVVLGCNIHDQMVGYIFVTDARWYGKTDTSGKLVLTDLSPGELDIAIWSPRIADKGSALKRRLKMTHASETVEFQLSKDLRAAPEPRPRNPDWDY
jgi:plastocyanin